MNFEYLLFLGGYFIILLIVSFGFSRRMKSLEDFFLASRKLSSTLVYVSLTASWLGATSILITIDEAYKQGVSSFWIIGVPAVLTGLGFAIFLVKPIRKLPITTLPDLVEMRYGRLVRHMASVLIVWYMILLASSQMVAIGNFLKSFLGASYFYSLVLGSAVVFVYSIFGGYFSIVVTDGFQFFLVSGGILGLFFFLIDGSSFKSLYYLASQVGRESYFNIFYDFKKNILIVFSFILAWTISPIVWQRIQSARTERAARSGLFAAAGTFFLLYWSLVFIGMLSLSIFTSNSSEESILAALISTHVNRFFSLLLFIAVVAAIMSTMDTAINTGALSLTRDVFQQLVPKGRLENIITTSRLSTLLVGIMAFIIAAKLQSILKTLGLASEIMAEGLFVPGIAMIYLKKKYPMAGFLSLGLGGGYSVVGFLCSIEFIHLKWPEWPFSVPYGLLLSLMGFILGMVIDNRKRHAREALKDSQRA